jgi:hypothetical protein
LIKKNTKVIIEGEGELDWAGGMPLAKGEDFTVHEGGKTTIYLVSDKKVDCFVEGDEQIVNVVYTLRRK